MNKFFIITSIIISIQDIQSASLGMTAAEITEGNCTDGTKKDVVFREHVKLAVVPLETKTETVRLNYL